MNANQFARDSTLAEADRAEARNERSQPISGSFPSVISKNAYNGLVKSSEFKRWLAALGATFTPGKGSHLRVDLNGKKSVLPMHNKELKKGLVEGIKKQLGLK